ncbi:DegT/DnrJ/EryC1/StrS family aminotransferase [Gemmatimonadota bacterium]
MKIRRQLPVHSPISFTSLLAGLRVLLFGNGDQARDAVRKLIFDFYRPLDLILTDSGTSALTLALGSACERVGRKLVALPAYCCYDVATAADGAGVEVVLYDVSPDTLGPVLDSLAAALTHKPAAVVLAHLYGVPIDFDTILPLIAKTDALLVEDAALGHGASYRGRPLGAFGSLSVLSFGRGKGVTGGSGGALLANDVAGASVLKDCVPKVGPADRGFGTIMATAAQWLVGRPLLYWLPASLPFLKLGETIYKPTHAPISMSAAATAILAKNWRLASSEAEERKSNGAQLYTIVEDLDGVQQPLVKSECEAGYLRFPLVVDDELLPPFRTTGARRLGIMPGYPTSLIDLEGFTGRCRTTDCECSAARNLANNLFTVPTHGKRNNKDLRELRGWLKATQRS